MSNKALASQNSPTILVRCPKCKHCASVRSREDVAGSMPSRTLLRCSCTECTHQWRIELSGDIPGDPSNPEIPLWLQTRCRGNILWALNAEHLDDLEHLIKGRMRKMTYAYTYFRPWRLPKWMIYAKNREAVLKGIQRLRAKLPVKPAYARGIQNLGQ